MIKVNETQQNFLKTELGIYEIPTEKNKIYELIVKLVELLSNKGLKEDSEPNEYGLKVEESIDIFNREYYN